MNPYSDYLSAHRCRPDAKVAATIGRMMATRVKANDGRLYPALTAEQKAERRREQEQVEAESERLGEVYNASGSLFDLARLQRPSAVLVREMPPAHLEMALEALDAAEARMKDLAAALRGAKTADGAG